MRDRKRKIVYSTDPEFEPPPRVKVRRQQSLPPGEQTAEIRREKKGRGGKEVTVIMGLQLSDKDFKALAKQLKKRCGSGGTLKDDTIEIQGDHRETVAAELQKLGYGTKFVGG